MDRSRRAAPSYIALSAVAAIVLAAPPSAGLTARSLTLDQVAERLGVRVVRAGSSLAVRCPHGAVTGAAARGGELRKYEGMLARELALYPGTLLAKAGLRQVTLCRALAFDGQPRAAVPEFGSGVLFLDVGRSGYAPFYDRKALHHDLFHVIDYRDDGLLYEDKGWSALNPPGFAYSRGGGMAQQGLSFISRFRVNLPGFVSRYATSGVEEDKAETFTSMMVRLHDVTRLAEKDRVVARKVAFLKNMLLALSPEAGDDFWAAVDRHVKAASAPSEHLHSPRYMNLRRPGAAAAYRRILEYHGFGDDNAVLARGRRLRLVDDAENAYCWAELVRRLDTRDWERGLAGWDGTDLLDAGDSAER